MTTAPGVTIDLRAAQRPSYRARGIGRYATGLTLALVRHHRALLERVVVDPALPAPEGLGEIAAAGLAVATARWEEWGGVYLAPAAYDPDASLRDVWPPVVTARRMRLAVVAHDLIPEALPDIYLGDPGRRRRYRARSHLLRAADHLLANSATTGADLRRYLGIDPSRVSVIGGACDERFAPPADRAAARSAARAAVGGLGPRWVLYNGAIEPRKNTETLVEAYAALPGALRQRWQLVVACALAPLERNHLEVRAAQLGIAGQLVLPGAVDDAALVALNQAAELVVFPSLYEGFGFPVAEALACGAPVIAAAGSAPAELVDPAATFDPTSPPAITGAMARGLTDDGFRAALARWAARPPVRWAEVAARAATALAGLLAAGPPPRPRPRIALVTPLPPQRTGVAGYSAALIEALVGRASVDVYPDGDDPGGVAATLPSWAFATGLAPARLPRAAALGGGYDGVVVALGNSEFHAGGLGLVRRGDLVAQGLPVVALAHDVRLSALYDHAEHRGVLPEGFAAVFAALYPGREHLLDAGGHLPAAAGEQSGILMCREVIAKATVFAVTSCYAARLARLDARPGEAAKVAVLPFAYPTPVRRPGPPEDRLVGSFGILNPSKHPHLLVDTIARMSGAKLVFVGAVGDAERAEITAYAARAGAAVEIVGFSDQATYDAWLGRAAVAVQLRRQTNGESSAAMADCLAHGVAMVVADVGAARELPPSVTKVPPDIAPAELAEVLDGLLADPAALARRGAEAQRWAAERGFDRAAEDLLALVASLRSAEEEPSPPDGRNIHGIGEAGW